MSNILRWIALPFVVGLSFFGAAYAGSYLGSSMGYWQFPPMGFAAAVAVVCSAYICAPFRKRTIATLALFLGAELAWLFLSPPSQFPLYYERAPGDRTYLPILATYAGGVVAWLVCINWHAQDGASKTHLRRVFEPFLTVRVIAVLIIVAAWYGWWKKPPKRSELLLTGNELIELIETSRKERGASPQSLDDLDDLDLTLWYGGWRYSTEGDQYTLEIGDYLEHGFSFIYSSESKQWFTDT